MTRRDDGLAAFAGPVRHVYVHVPFCRERCDYCEFASQAIGGPAPGPAGASRELLLERYVAALTAEWERERAAHDVRRLTTLYLGGGTPSLLGPDRLERLLGRFRPYLTPHAEVSVETNPEDVDEAYAAWAASAGVRVSLGAQSFAPELRDVLGRRAAADPGAAFRALRAAGVRNIGFDLMHGIPGQSPALLGEDIATVVAMRPEHVSWYELDVIEGTALAARLGAGATHEIGARLDADAMPADPGDEVRAEGYRRIVRGLSRAGYDWYEVSNFALPGRRARHNVAYWRARPYLGLGPGAVGTVAVPGAVGAAAAGHPGAAGSVAARRWRDSPGTEAWLAALEAGERPPREVEDLDAATLAWERLLLAARCGLRLPVAGLGAAYDAKAAAALAGAGLVSLHSGTIRVTRKGRYVANEVCVRLFRATHLRG